MSSVIIVLYGTRPMNKENVKVLDIDDVLEKLSPPRAYKKKYLSVMAEPNIGCNFII